MSPPPPPPKGKKMSLLECIFNNLIGCIANSILRIGSHHFWLELVPFPKIVGTYCYYCFHMFCFHPTPSSLATLLYLLWHWDDTILWVCGMGVCTNGALSNTKVEQTK